ncbi:hypothetical protein HOLleu_19729 [Holothuria leucospilota]|uniref:Uncharacterized protein n=1 Tax=Holothuria leucospilota TaxID=206669 RepID=A0A9Q1H7V4_HOLLE|nr:hypothetical protein HOLleu_19729 [Holothuria leucospilota]
MQPSNQQQQVMWGNHACPVVTSGSLETQNSSNGNLWGSSIRRSMGNIQIACGIMEFALGITLLGLPLSPYLFYPYVAWGVWNGVFAVTTGFLGLYSKRSKGMVITYMIMSIIAAVLSAICCAFTAAFTPSVASYRRSSYYGYRGYHDDRYKYANAHFVIYITLSIIFALQMLFSILGAIFTCGALTSQNNQRQIAYQINAQPPSQPFGPVPPYTALAMQPQSYNSAGTNPLFHAPGTFVTGTTANPSNAAGTTGNGAITMGANLPYVVPK